MLTVQTPSHETPALDWGSPFELQQGTFSSPGPQRAILPATPGPTLPIIHEFQPRAPLCGTTGLTQSLGALPGRASPPPSHPGAGRRRCCSDKGDPPPPAPPPTRPLRWGWTQRVPGGPQEEGSRPGGDLNTRGRGRLRGSLGGENKGGQREASGRHSQTQRGQLSRCGSRRGRKQRQRPRPPPPRCLGTPAFLREGSPKPRRGRPRRRLCAATPGGGGGRGRGKQGRAEGARERAARPRPPSGRPLPSRSGALFVPARGPEPEGAACPGVR